MYADKALVPQLVATYLPLGVIAMIVGSLAGRPMNKEALDRFYLLLRTPVGHEDRLRREGVNVVYAGHSNGHPWELNHPALVNVGGFIIALVFSGAILTLLWALAHIGS
jgi:hypothetical protein